MNRPWHGAWWPEHPRACFAVAVCLSIAAGWIYTASAHAGQFTPPTRLQAQRILGDAYDARLRPRYPRSGITTRCRGGGRYLLCSIHVWRRGEELYWQITQVRLASGKVRTSLSPNLEGVVRIPSKTLFYRSTPANL